MINYSALVYNLCDFCPFLVELRWCAIKKTLISFSLIINLTLK